MHSLRGQCLSPHSRTISLIRYLSGRNSLTRASYSTHSTNTGPPPAPSSMGPHPVPYHLIRSASLFTCLDAVFSPMHSVPPTPKTTQGLLLLPRPWPRTRSPTTHSPGITATIAAALGRSTDSSLLSRTPMRHTRPARDPPLQLRARAKRGRNTGAGTPTRRTRPMRKTYLLLTRTRTQRGHITTGAGGCLLATPSSYCPTRTHSPPCRHHRNSRIMWWRGRARVWQQANNCTPNTTSATVTEYCRERGRHRHSVVAQRLIAASFSRHPTAHFRARRPRNRRQSCCPLPRGPSRKERTGVGWGVRSVEW